MSIFERLPRHARSTVKPALTLDSGVIVYDVHPRFSRTINMCSKMSALGVLSVSFDDKNGDSRQEMCRKLVFKENS